jgi:phage-related protein
VAAITKKAVESYAEYEQLAGGVETLFKNSADVLMGYADKAYQTAGLSANEYMATVTSFSASLLQSLGGDTAKSADYANQAIIDMSDNANKMGTSMEMIQNAYQGFAKQNYTMLDNLKLGYGGTKEEMQRLLDDAEKISGTKYDISSFADVTQAIHVMQTELGITGTTAKEASTTIQGSASAMKASWENLLVGMADESMDFDALLKNFIESVGTFAENLVPRIKVALGGIIKLISSLAPMLVKELPTLLQELLPMALTAIIDIVMAISEVLPSLLKTVITSLVSVLPTLIPQLVTAITQLIVLILENINDITMPIIDALPLIVESVMSALLSNMPIIIKALISATMEIVKALPRILGSLLKAFLKYWTTIWESIKSVFSNVGGWFGEKFGDAWENVKKKFSKVKEFFSGVWQKIKDVFSKVGTSIGGAVSGAVKGAVNKVLSNATRIINGFIRGINVAVGVINAIPGVNIKKINQLSIPKLAKGAVLPPNKPFLAMVGDQKSGTNVEAPLDTIVDAMKIALGGSKGFNGRIEVPLYLNGKQIALAIRDAENELGTQTVFGGFANAY